GFEVDLQTVDFVLDFAPGVGDVPARRHLRPAEAVSHRGVEVRLEERLITALRFVDDELDACSARRMAAQADLEALDLARGLIGHTIGARRSCEVERDACTPVLGVSGELSGDAVFPVFERIPALRRGGAVADRINGALDPEFVVRGIDVRVGVHVGRALDASGDEVRVVERLELRDADVDGAGRVAARNEDLQRIEDAVVDRGAGVLDPPIERHLRFGDPVILALTDHGEAERGGVAIEVVDERDARRDRGLAHDLDAEPVQTSLELVGHLLVVHVVEVEADAGTPVRAEILIARGDAGDAICAVAVGVAGLRRGDAVSEGVPIALDSEPVVPEDHASLGVDVRGGIVGADVSAAAARFAGRSRAARVATRSAVRRIARCVDAGSVAVALVAVFAPARTGFARATARTGVVARTAMEAAGLRVHAALPAGDEPLGAFVRAGTERTDFVRGAGVPAGAAMVRIGCRVDALPFAAVEPGLAAALRVDAARPRTTRVVAGAAVIGVV